MTSHFQTQYLAQTNTPLGSTGTKLSLFIKPVSCIKEPKHKGL